MMSRITKIIRTTTTNITTTATNIKICVPVMYTACSIVDICTLPAAEKQGKCSVVNPPTAHPCIYQRSKGKV